MSWRFLAASSLVSLAALASAQEPVSPTPPEEVTTQPGPGPAITYLMTKFSLPEAEARERLEVQAELMNIAKELYEGSDPAFSDTWIEHQPVFKVVFAFADNRDRKDLLERLPPKLRRYTQLKLVPRGRAKIRADQQAVRAALNSAGVQSGGGYDPITGKFDIVVQNVAAAQAVRAGLPPSLRGDVSIRFGDLYKAEAPPTGVQTGDFIAAGFPLYPVRTDAQCTFGYPVRFKPVGSTTELKGVLTAKHCGTKAEYYYRGHWITFSSPVVTHPGTGIYDYQIFESTGLGDNSGNEVYYNNASGISGKLASGYYKIYAWAASTSQSVGNVVCKSGQQTNLTCGVITKKDAGPYQGVDAWIEVGQSSQPDISYDGDSGAPWFFDPGTGTRAIATGLHVAGAGTGPSATALYMPLERIDDHNSSVRLMLSPM